MKKIFLAIISALLAASLLVACGSAASSSSAVLSSETRPESSAQTKDTNYLLWKFEDWDNADEQEQKKCAEAYIKGIISASGEGGDVTDEEIEAMQDYLVSTLSIMFTSDKEATLQQLIDGAVADMESVK